MVLSWGFNFLSLITNLITYNRYYYLLQFPFSKIPLQVFGIFFFSFELTSFFTGWKVFFSYFGHEFFVSFLNFWYFLPCCNWYFYSVYGIFWWMQFLILLCFNLLVFYFVVSVLCFLFNDSFLAAVIENIPLYYILNLYNFSFSLLEIDFLIWQDERLWFHSISYRYHLPYCHLFQRVIFPYLSFMPCHLALTLVHTSINLFFF